MRLFWVDTLLTKGRVAITARPLGGDRLYDEIAELKREHVSAVLSLLEPDEISELELDREGEACAENGISFVSFPVADRGLPADLKAFAAVIEDLANRVKAGESVVVHCRAGIGRSSVAAASILMLNGIDGPAALELLSQARRLSVPDTDAQRVWILALMPNPT